MNGKAFKKKYGLNLKDKYDINKHKDYVKNELFKPFKEDKNYSSLNSLLVPSRFIGFKYKKLAKKDITNLISNLETKLGLKSVSVYIKDDTLQTEIEYTFFIDKKDIQCNFCVLHDIDNSNIEIGYTNNIYKWQLEDEDKLKVLDAW